MVLRVVAFVAAASLSAWGQLSEAQKLAEFDQLTGIFAKGYGPHDWKKRTLGVDLFDGASWRDQIRASKSDLEFFQIMSRWVAQLDDAHDTYTTPANFIARLNFFVDIYDGKLLVDEVDRTRLPAAQYSFARGYELVSIDGTPATRILETMLPYGVAANPRSTRRVSAELVTIRPQSLIPNAPEVPEISTVVFRRFDGGLETYRIPWTKTGVAMTGVGVYPDPTGEEAPSEEVADFADPAERFLTFRLPRDRAIRGFGSMPPVFASSLPPNFTLRLGRLASDPFYSGTFEAAGYRIGYIRIPTFSPANLNDGLLNFVREISFFSENTDGLIVDVMRNPGGSAAYSSALASYLMPARYRTIGLEIRATSVWVSGISQTLQNLRAQGAPAALLSGFQATLDALVEANASERGLTRPVPWDFNPGLERDPLRDPRGNLLAYSKPLLLLTDEFSASAADGFAAIIQDNQRGPLYGYRTMGAGGNVTSWVAGPYSRSLVTLTESLMSRRTERQEAGYPASRYIENVGVHPDIESDYMTAANLSSDGRPFVEGFVRAMVEHIAKSRQ